MIYNCWEQALGGEGWCLHCRNTTAQPIKMAELYDMVIAITDNLDYAGKFQECSRFNNGNVQVATSDLNNISVESL